MLSSALIKPVDLKENSMSRGNRPTILLILDVAHIPQSRSTQRSKGQTCGRSHCCDSRHGEILAEGCGIIVVSRTARNV